MGYSLVKYLESAEYHRALFYLDNGESDLPPVDKSAISQGSRAISQSTGQEWFLDSNFEWKPVRDLFSRLCTTNGLSYEPKPSVKSVQIKPESLTMNKNANATLFAEVIGDDIVDRKVHWEIISSKSADTYISQDGFIHIGNYVKPKVITVRATSLLDNKKYKDCTIQVDPYAQLFGEVYFIDISPKKLSLGKGKSIQLIANVYGNGSYSKVVEWSCSSPRSTIDSDGNLVIGEDESETIIIVTATSSFNPSVTCSIPIIVEEDEKAPTIESVAIIPSDFSMATGSFATLAAEVKGTGNFIEDVIWKVTATSPNTQITNSGVLVIGEDEIPGEITVTAMSILNNEITDSITVTIDEEIDPKKKQVLQILVTPKSAEIAVTNNFIFNAKVLGINLLDERVYWKLLWNTSDYTKIKQNGICTIAGEEDSTTLIVEAAAYEDNTKVGRAAIKVLPPYGGAVSEAIVSVIDVCKENDQLIIKYSNGSSKVIENIQSKTYVPHMTQEEKILSFSLETDLPDPPAPVDLSVDLSPYALKEEIQLENDTIAESDVGGIMKGTMYEKGTNTKTIVEDVLGPRPEPPIQDIILYTGSSFEPPSSLEGMTKITGITKEQILAENLIISIPVEVDPETEEGQYQAVAIQKDLELIKWTQAATPDFPTNAFEKEELDDVCIYYLTTPVIEEIRYLLIFKEV